MSGPRRAPAPPLRLRLRSGAAARRAISYETKERRPDGGWVHFKPSRWGQCKSSRRLGGIHRFDNVELHDVTWDDRFINVYETRHEYQIARKIYALLKEVYSRQGDLKTSGDFYYREMECRRKESAGRLAQRVALTFQFCFWGYAQRPLRVLLTGLVLILVMTGVFSLLEPGRGLLNNLYFSAVSFTAIGYGGWVDPPGSAMRALGVLEAAAGVTIIASFVVTLTRKVLR